MKKFLLLIVLLLSIISLTYSQNNYYWYNARKINLDSDSTVFYFQTNTANASKLNRSAIAAAFGIHDSAMQQLSDSEFTIHSKSKINANALLSQSASLKYSTPLLKNTIYAQTILQKQVLVYFKTGVQRNAPSNQNTVTISSSNILPVLNSYGLSAKNVKQSFPDFNEADTVNARIGGKSRQMNRAKVFTISLPDTSSKSALINSLKNLSEVLYTGADGDAKINVMPAGENFSPQDDSPPKIVIELTELSALYNE